MNDFIFYKLHIDITKRYRSDGPVLFKLDHPHIAAQADIARYIVVLLAHLSSYSPSQYRLALLTLVHSW